MKHSNNGIALHALKCKGKLSREINNKPAGQFELWRCDSCKYLGRGDRVGDYVAPAKPRGKKKRTELDES